MAGSILTPIWPRTASLLLILAGCGYPQYQQTSGSQQAFAFADAIRAGARNGLPEQARAAGLLTSGVCREVGGGRLYCNAVRLDDIQFGTYYSLGGAFNFRYEELRMCLAPSEVAGFVSEGEATSFVPLPLYREYPEEFALMLGTDKLGVDDDPNGVLLQRFESLTGEPIGNILERLGFLGSADNVDVFSSDGLPDAYFVNSYPPHEPAVRACRSL